MRLPWVSRAHFETLLAQLERVQKERDEYRDRGDRIYDELIARFGYEPAAPRVRTELKEAAEAQVAAMTEITFEDPHGDGEGFLDNEIEATIDAAVQSQAQTKEAN